SSCSGWGARPRSWGRPSSASWSGKPPSEPCPDTAELRRSSLSAPLNLLKLAPSPSDTACEMSTIRTTCPRCGEVDMGPEAILLSVRQNGREGSYRFTCPNCADDVEKRADRKIVALLVSAGVDIDQADESMRQPALFDEEDDPRG